MQHECEHLLRARALATAEELERTEAWEQFVETHRRTKCFQSAASPPQSVHPTLSGGAIMRSRSGESDFQQPELHVSPVEAEGSTDQAACERAHYKSGWSSAPLTAWTSLPEKALRCQESAHLLSCYEVWQQPAPERGGDHCYALPLHRPSPHRAVRSHMLESPPRPDVEFPLLALQASTCNQRAGTPPPSYCNGGSSSTWPIRYPHSLSLFN